MKKEVGLFGMASLDGWGGIHYRKISSASSPFMPMRTPSLAASVETALTSAWSISSWVLTPVTMAHVSPVLLHVSTLIYPHPKKPFAPLIISRGNLKCRCSLESPFQSMLFPSIRGRPDNIAVLILPRKLSRCISHFVPVTLAVHQLNDFTKEINVSFSCLTSSFLPVNTKIR